MNDSRPSDGHRDSQSPEEIKADIEQTRAQMESKINQIQYKLDPDRLKEQAQETVRGMVTDSSNAAMDYMRRHKEEISSSMLDAVKNNPIPTALIGLGLGWLALESMSPKRDRFEYNRRLPVRRDDAARYESGYGYDTRYADTWREEQWGEYGQTPTYGEWQGSSAAGRRRDYESYSGVDRAYAAQYPQQYAGQGRQERGWTQEAQSQAKGMAENVKETIKDTAQSIGEKAGEAVDAVRDAAGQAGEEMRTRTEQIGERARGQAEEMRYRTRDQAGQFGHQMGDRGQALRMQARQAGRRLEHQVEDNPLMFGAVAFAVGAAVAMLMPRTRIENRYIGEARDQVMETAQEMGQEAVERAQHVVEEVRPELEQAAKRVAEDVKQTGQEAAEDLKQTAQKAQDKAKQEGKGLAEDAKNQAKSQASGEHKAPENWTTLKGRWKEIKGDAKRQWGKLTDDDLTRIEGDYEKLVGLIQQKYGYSRSQAEQEINTFSRSRAS